MKRQVEGAWLLEVRAAGEATVAAQEGAALVIASSNRARIDAALKTLPANAEGHAVDLGSENAIAALFAGLGGFDHLVYTAGENLQLASLEFIDVAATRELVGLTSRPPWPRLVLHHPPAVLLEVLRLCWPEARARLTISAD